MPKAQSWDAARVHGNLMEGAGEGKRGTEKETATLSLQRSCSSRADAQGIQEKGPDVLFAINL